MQSPSQVQRLMQLLSSNSTNGPAPISTPMTGPTQSGSWTPPAALDLPQLTQLALYDNCTGAGGNSVLTFDSNKDAVGPSATQVAEDEARLALTYQDASEVDADVDVLQANINALIENMGFDSVALATTTTPSATSIHPQPPLPLSEGGMLPPQTPADFDFESFLTAFTDAQDSEVGATDVEIDAVVGDRISPVPRSMVSGSDSALGMETDSIKESTVQSTVAGIGRKRTSDVAELGSPLPEPPKSMLSSHVVPATRTDAPAGDPPRAKRNKK
jgi:heat shock transcription factor